MDLPDPIDAKPGLTPVAPPPGSPDAARRTGEPAPTVAPAAAAPPRPLPAERLTFAGRPRAETITLDWPFERDGTLVETVTVRRLTVAEVAEVVDGEDFARFDLWALYAAQTGLPVGVLRGLDQDDGGRVRETCRSFLPRVFAAMLADSEDAATASASIPATGAAASPA